jgi:hypothetical protein
VHDAPQGAGGTPHMPLQVKVTEKLAERFSSHAAFETKHKHGG